MIKTLVSLDREKWKEIRIPLLVADGGTPAQSATVTLTLQVADLNDNPMKEGRKRVLVNNIQVRLGSKYFQR